MCIRPQHIRNGKAKYFNLANSFITEMDVPCGQCIQCVMSAKNDLYLRTLQEYKDCVNSGGIPIFLTFTYDEDHVPYKQYYLDDSGFINLVPCPRSESNGVLMTFDKSHMINYLKRLRKYVKSHYDLDGCLRYICVPEYGTKNTQRPHYHAIFFLTKELASAISSLDSRSMNNLNFMFCHRVIEFFSKFWPYGMVSASDAGLIVNSDSCMNYVTKYVCKNAELLHYSRFDKFFDFITDCFNNCYLECPYGHYFKSPMSYFLYYCKFFECSFYVVKSVGFGLSMLDSLERKFDFTDESQFSDIVTELKRGIQVPNYHSGSTRSYPYPRYITKKLFFDTRKDGSYYLKERTYKLFIEYRVQQLYDFVDYVRQFDFNKVSTIPSTAFTDNGLLSPLNEEVTSLSSDFPKVALSVFVYDSFIRNRYICNELSPTVGRLFRSLVKSDLNYLSERDKVREIVMSLTPIHVENDSFVYEDFVFDYDGLDLSTTLNLLFHCPGTRILTHYGRVYRPSLSDLYSKLILPHCDRALQLWNFISNYQRASLLNVYESLNRESKILSDILNQKHYGISKNRPRSVLSASFVPSVR